MKGKTITIILATLILTASSVFGVTSTANITSTMTAADGAQYTMSGAVSMLGYNYASSTNSLWIQLYKEVSGPNQLISESNMAIGGTASWAPNVPSGTYYVHLDPSGPLGTGCNGYGRAEN